MALTHSTAGRAPSLPSLLYAHALPLLSARNADFSRLQFFAMSTTTWYVAFLMIRCKRACPPPLRSATPNLTARAHRPSLRQLAPLLVGAPAPLPSAYTHSHGRTRTGSTAGTTCAASGTTRALRTSARTFARSRRRAAGRPGSCSRRCCLAGRGRRRWAYRALALFLLLLRLCL